jgi:hypothetical protein
MPTGNPAPGQAQPPSGQNPSDLLRQEQLEQLKLQQKLDMLKNMQRQELYNNQLQQQYRLGR